MADIDNSFGGTGFERYVRYTQSGDVIYLSSAGGAGTANTIEPKKIERRGRHSFSLVRYNPNDGPFRNINISNTQINPTNLTGDVTLDADRPLFRQEHIGALFKITSIGQKVKLDVTGGNQFTDPIRVSGVEDGRKFQILITQSTGFSATLRVLRS